MPSHPPIAFVNARLIDPVQGTETRGGLIVIDGVIAGVGAAITRDQLPVEARVIDCEGDVVAPGLIDMRAFVGEPGAEHRETIASASAAAAAGGVTTLVTRPDTNPPVDDPAVVDFILRRARDDAKVRVHPAAALTKGLGGEEIAEIGLLAEAGAIAFSDGAHSVADARTMRRAMTYARDFDALVAPVCEDRSLSGEGVMAEGLRASWLGLPGVPREAETIVLERDLRLVALTGARYHAALVSNRLSLEAMARARHAGWPATCGVSINHLTLNELDVGDYRTFLKLMPPLRGEDERMALVEALSAGLIDIICLRSRSAGRRDQAAAVRGSRGGRDRRRDDAVGELAPGCGRRCDAAPPHPRNDRAAGRNPEAAGRQAYGRRAGGRHSFRSGRALCARSGLASFALPQHALRCRTARGPGQDDAGCRPGRARIVFGQEISFTDAGWKRSRAGFIIAERWRWRLAIV